MISDELVDITWCTSRPGKTRITTDRVRKRTIDSFPRMISYTEDTLAVQEPREKEPKEAQQP